MLEEVLETINALGFSVYAMNGSDSVEVTDQSIQFEEDDSITGTPEQLAEVVDGCCDVAVVTTGTLCALGVGDAHVQDLVNDNNLAKFGPGHWYRDDGKLMKPSNHTKPDLVGALFSRGTISDVTWSKVEAVGDRSGITDIYVNGNKVSNEELAAEFGISFDPTTISGLPMTKHDDSKHVHVDFTVTENDLNTDFGRYSPGVYELPNGDKLAVD